LYSEFTRAFIINDLLSTILINESTGGLSFRRKFKGKENSIIIHPEIMLFG
jgi:hypothetical protein